MNWAGVASVAVGGLLFVILLWIVGPERTIGSLLAVPAELALAFFGLTALFYLLRAVRWKILLQYSSNQPSLKTTFWTTMVGYMVNTIIPLRVGGEIVRAYIVDAKDRVGLPQGLSSVAVERILDLLAIVALASGSLFLLQGETQLPSWMFQALQVVAALVLVSILVLAFATWRSAWLLERISGMMRRLPLLKESARERLGEFLHFVVVGATSTLRHPVALGSTVILTFAVWGVLFLSFYLFFPPLGLQSSPWLIMLGVMIFQLSFILPSSPGSLGTFELVWTVVFAGLGFFQSEKLLAIALVTHLGNLLFVLALGSAGVGVLRLRFADVIRFRRPIENQFSKSSLL